MSIVVAILGLALLIVIHELGHFYGALAVGMRPRGFSIGFGPPLAKVRRNDIDYAFRAVPLGGYVTIPGMTRPQSSDVDAFFGGAVRDAPELVGPAERLKRALSAGEWDQAQVELDALGAGAAESGSSKGIDRGLRHLRDSLSDDAYWRQSIWRRIVAIAAGPATNLAFAVIVFAIVFAATPGAYRLGFVLGVDDRAQPTRVIEEVLPDRPAAAAGFEPGDVIVAVNNKPVDTSGITTAIRGSKGDPIIVTVRRDGQLLRLGPVSAVKDGDYTLGESISESVSFTLLLTREIGRSLGNIVHKEGREQIASPIGIVRESSTAARSGWESYLAVLAFISLSLGLLNLLPLLPLDGGHIVFAIAEKIRGHAIRREIYERVSVIGIAVVLLLFFVGLTNDVGRLGGG
jgi:regulator of sigma E protease